MSLINRSRRYKKSKSAPQDLPKEESAIPVQNTKPWLLALAVFAVVSNVLSALMSTVEGPAAYIFITIGGIVILPVLLLGLQERAVGASLVFFGAVMLAAGGNFHVASLSFIPQNIAGWIGVASASLLGVICVMTWASRSETNRPSRNF